MKNILGDKKCTSPQQTFFSSDQMYQISTLQYVFARNYSNKT